MNDKDLPQFLGSGGLSLSSYSNDHFHNFNFDPFPILDEKYNSDLNVSNFYIHTRHLSVPKSQYMFLNSFLD